MDIYKDVIDELKRQKYEVDFLPTPFFDSDPRSFTSLRRISKYLVSEKYFSIKITKYWLRILSSSPYNKNYDILFVIDGHGIRKVVFDILKDRNPNLKAVNYLFDTTTGVYQFEKNFQYYDKVFSFDSVEVKKYGLNFLPIFWTSIKSKKKEYDFFGMGYYNKQRYELFEVLKKITEEKKYNSYLKLYYFAIQHISWYKLKYNIKKILGLSLNIDPKIYNTDIITHSSLSPSEFKDMIAKSRITIDTCAPHQVGMTARYMWALGNGEKIITTNLNAQKEGLSEENQVYVIKHIDLIKADKAFGDFLAHTYTQSTEQASKMLPYRIDNWIKTILGD